MLPQQDCGDVSIIHTVLIPCKFLLSYVGKLLKNGTQTSSEDAFFRRIPACFLGRTIVICPVEGSVGGRFNLTCWAVLGCSLIGTNNPISHPAGQIKSHSCHFIVIFSEIQLDSIFKME